MLVSVLAGLVMRVGCQGYFRPMVLQILISKVANIHI